MNGFCVECGKEVDSTIKGLCMECFLKDRTLVTLPDHVDLLMCTNCGQFFWHGEWQSMDREAAAVAAAREALSCIKEGKVVSTTPSVSYLDDYNLSVTLACRVQIGDVVTDALATTVIRVKNSVCKICSRRLGNYYEAILQIRTSEKTLSKDLQDEVLARVEKVVDETMATDDNVFITKMEIVPGGVDVYLSLIAVGRALAKDLGEMYCAETNESAKLVGQTRDGLDMYRVNYLVRLPEFHVGDIVIFRKHYYLLSRVSNQGGKLIALSGFRETSVKRQDISEIKVYCKAAEIGTADVITVSDGEIQVMDPSNYSMVDLLVPRDAEIGEKVRVIRIEEVLYFVP